MAENMQEFTAASAGCRDIWVVAELRAGQPAACTLELLGEARRLAEGVKNQRVAAVLLDAKPEQYAPALIAAGADIVYQVGSPVLQHFRDQPYTDVISALAREYKPLVLLLSATATGRSLAARLAARLQTGLAADCVSLELQDNGLLVQTRPIFGGSRLASMISPRACPQMATVRPKAVKPLKADNSRQGEIIAKQFALNEADYGVKVLECLEQDNEASVEEAEVVVAAGFGAASDEGLQLVSGLAQALVGAFGGTRKLVDAGFIKYEKQIGQTGKTVGPQVYICCGISGAVQHIVGISSSGLIVAIDQDANAPIFQVADIGIVADLYEFIPQLIAARKARCGA